MLKMNFILKKEIVYLRTSKSIVFYFRKILYFFLIVENKLIDKEYEYDDKVIDANQMQDDVVYIHDIILFRNDFVFDHMHVYDNHIRV